MILWRVVFHELCNRTSFSYSTISNGHFIPAIYNYSHDWSFNFGNQAWNLLSSFFWGSDLRNVAVIRESCLITGISVTNIAGGQRPALLVVNETKYVFCYT